MPPDYTPSVCLPVYDAAGAVIAVVGLCLAAPLPPGDPTWEALEILTQKAALALERQDLLRQVAAEARRDPLTAVANRRRWDEELPAALARSARAGADVVVLLIDLDHFKVYNDTHGHPAGDALLVKATQAWGGCVREVDLLARIGGEEFAVLLPATDVPGALEVARRLRAAVPDAQTCSIGIARWDRLEPAEWLVARADAALYRAKETGRDQAVVAREGPSPGTAGKPVAPPVGVAAPSPRAAPEAAARTAAAPVG